MYEIFDTTTREVLSLTDEPRYVYRSPRNGVWIRCDEEKAECVAVNGTRYSLKDKTPISDAPTTVSIRKADAAAKLRTVALESIAHAQTLDEVKAAYTDLAEAVIDLYLNPVQ